MRSLFHAVRALVAVPLLATCAREITGLADEEIRVSIVSGNEQTGIAGRELRRPIVIAVVGASSAVALRRVVDFVVISGDGRVYTESVLSNNQGRATNYWTLGTDASKPQVLEIRSIHPTTGRKIVHGVVLATASPGPVTQLLVVAGDGQAAPAGTTVATAPRVRAADEYGNGVSHVPVTFAVGAGGGGVAGPDAETDAQGLAGVASWKLGTTAGANTLTVSDDAAHAVTFAATASAGTVTQLRKMAGDGLTTVVHTLLGTAPQVMAVDQYDNPVGGVPIAFAVVSGGGIVTGGTQTTDPQGLAAAGGWMLGPAAGLNTLEAITNSLGALSATFTATGRPGPAAQIQKVAGDNQSAPAGDAVGTAPRVRLTDQYGNGIGPVPITFGVGAGGGSVAGADASTDDEGYAAGGGWTLGTVAGLNTVVATSGALSATFIAAGVPGSPASLEKAAGNGQSALVRTSVATALRVAVTDRFGNRVPNVVVTFAAALGGGSIGGAAPLTDAGGQAAAGSWTLGRTPGRNTVTATVATSVGAIATSFDATAIPFGALAGGATASCGLTTAGQAYCWGRNRDGQLGDGSGTNRLAPVPVLAPDGGGLGSLGGLAAGESHACALTMAGQAYCWGLDTEGQLGDGARETQLAPVLVLPPSGGAPLAFGAIAAGAFHTCGLTTAGQAYCWGQNRDGQLGDNSTTRRLTPVPVSGPAGDAPLTFVAITAGLAHTCGLTSAGDAYCWGVNSDGQLGDGSLARRLTPTAVSVSTTLAFGSLVAGARHTCALTTAGRAYCWGRGNDGQLGIGSPAGARSPVAVRGPAGGALLTFGSIAAGDNHSCGVTLAGEGYCWGRNIAGQLGDGSTSMRAVPVAVVAPSGGAPIGFRRLEGGKEHTCGLSTLNQAYCWGRNVESQFGDGTITSRSTPTAIP